MGSWIYVGIYCRLVCWWLYQAQELIRIMYHGCTYEFLLGVEQNRLKSVLVRQLKPIKIGFGQAAEIKKGISTKQY
jgi:hypothetical protein